MNGEPKIKNSIIFISLFPETTLKTLFDADLVLLKGQFLWYQTFLQLALSL